MTVTETIVKIIFIKSENAFFFKQKKKNNYPKELLQPPTPKPCPFMGGNYCEGQLPWGQA